MPNNSIGVPTSRSMGTSFRNYGVGFLGGAVYMLAKNMLGNGLLASLTAPILASSVVKGAAGDTISTLAGFDAAQSLGLFGNGGGNGGGNSRGEM